MSLKLFYLTAEIAPFCESYSLANFSRKFTNRLNLKNDVDIRVSQPKYGYVSERKYILREVIRLRDLPIIFNAGFLPYTASAVAPTASCIFFVVSLSAIKVFI